jgi:transglutaminase-like putative cysteine protease
MPVLTVRHVTTYRYKQPVAFGEHRMMLRPRDSHDQKLLDSKLAITPEPVDIRWVHDVFGNCVAIAQFSGRGQELRFEGVIRLDHWPTNALDFTIEAYAEKYPFTYGADEMPDLLRSIERQYLDPDHEIDHWAKQFLRRDGRSNTVELLASMTHAIHETLTYVAREESGIQDPVGTLRLGSGSCRDFAVLMMEAVRSATAI